MQKTFPSVDSQFIKDSLVEILDIPSPTGFTQAALDWCEKALSPYPGLEIQRVPKGAILATWTAKRQDKPRAITAHVDTLGFVVKEIKANGRLKLSKIAGGAWNVFEGEGCTIFTSSGQQFRGCLLLEKASGHIHGTMVNELKREESNMEVRIDARTASPDETRGLGIEVGDFVAFDPRVEINNDFIRSRYLDDKACVACMIAAVRSMSQAGLVPVQKTYLHFTDYEEVGHGGCFGIPADTAELVSLDMAAVGEGQNSDEFHASLCTKDANGPYDHVLSQKLRHLAEVNQIAYKVDVYTHYSSDAKAYWKAGGNAVVALFGPGVDASHNYERTHIEALVATTQWMMAYLLSE